MADTRLAVGSHALTESDLKPAVDESRIALVRRTVGMTIEERLDLFEQLSADAAWVRNA